MVWAFTLVTCAPTIVDLLFEMGDMTWLIAIVTNRTGSYMVEVTFVALKMRTNISPQLLGLYS